MVSIGVVRCCVAALLRCPLLRCVFWVISCFLGCLSSLCGRAPLLLSSFLVVIPGPRSLLFTTVAGPACCLASLIFIVLSSSFFGFRFSLARFLSGSLRLCSWSLLHFVASASSISSVYTTFSVPSVCFLLFFPLLLSFHLRFTR